MNGFQEAPMLSNAFHNGFLHVPPEAGISSRSIQECVQRHTNICGQQNEKYLCMRHAAKGEPIWDSATSLVAD
jgi:hypothetical protein